MNRQQNDDPLLVHKPSVEEEKKIDEKLLPEPLPKFKRLEKVERRPSIDISKLDPATFKEKFKGFGKEDYEEVQRANAEFFLIGHANYVKAVKNGMKFHIY